MLSPILCSQKKFCSSLGLEIMFGDHVWRSYFTSVLNKRNIFNFVYYTSCEGKFKYLIWSVDVSRLLSVCVSPLTEFLFLFAIRKYFNFAEISKALLALVSLWFCSAFSDRAVYKEAHVGLYACAHSFFSPFEYLVELVRLGSLQVDGIWIGKYMDYTKNSGNVRREI
jgi:hypothetical protein